MKRYDDLVLNKLLDRYERSTLYRGTNRRKVHISLPIDRRLIPEYFDETWTGYTDVHDQLAVLEEEGFLTLGWKDKKEGHILEKCILNPDRILEIYHRLGRKSRAGKEEKILELAFAIKDCLPDFYSWLEERISKGKSIKKYVDMDDAGRFEQVCRMIRGILGNRQAVFLRAFSIQIFCDSKMAEKDMGNALRILSTFHPEERFHNLEPDEILEEYEIYRNPSWIMMKGSGRFRIASADYVDIAAFPGGIGISQEAALSILWDPGRIPERIVTIENLTSFHQWEEAGALAIYLGGYANRIKREFLLSLFRIFPDISFRHFGDIDCGGFRIWKNLCAQTGIPIRTLHMDEETFRQYEYTGRPLTDHDVRTLKTMIQDPFYLDQKDLFALMLDRNIKIEQEGIAHPAWGRRSNVLAHS